MAKLDIKKDYFNRFYDQMVFNISLYRKGKDLIKAVASKKKDAGLGDFTVGEAMNTFNMLASDMESEAAIAAQDGTKPKRKPLKKEKNFEKSVCLFVLISQLIL